jgi:N-formylglutamate amidohydrolase
VPALQPRFDILAPAQWTLPMVFNSPHSGAGLPDGFAAMSKLSATALHQSEDTHVDELFSGCVEHGVPLLRSLVSRSYLDLNREPWELDPRMFEGELPIGVNATSSRVACGLGTIPRIVADGLEIYRGRIPVNEALARIDLVYRPYHRTLAALLAEAHAATGQVLLVDCHSMPSSAVADLQFNRGRRVDVVLGDRHGMTCHPAIMSAAENLLADRGLVVRRNKPYAGGFITENHGNPAAGHHAIQVEINRALYMNEYDRRKNGGFSALKAVLDDLATTLAPCVQDMANALPRALAAE